MLIKRMVQEIRILGLFIVYLYVVSDNLYQKFA